MGATLVRYGKGDGQAERRQRIATGKICAMVFDLIAAQPDLTLDEVMMAKKAARIPGSRSAVGRFFRRHDLTVKKKPVRWRRHFSALPQLCRAGWGAVIANAPSCPKLRP